MTDLALRDHPADSDPLSPREKTIVKLLVEGKTPKEIAERVEKIGVDKTQLPLISMLMLGVLA